MKATLKDCLVVSYVVKSSCSIPLYDLVTPFLGSYATKWIKYMLIARHVCEYL